MEINTNGNAVDRIQKDNASASISGCFPLPSSPIITPSFQPDKLRHPLLSHSNNSNDASSKSTSIRRVRSPNPFASKPVISPSSNPFYKTIASNDTSQNQKTNTTTIAAATAAVTSLEDGSTTPTKICTASEASLKVGASSMTMDIIQNNSEDNANIKNESSTTISSSSLIMISSSSSSDNQLIRLPKKQKSLPIVPHQANGTGTEIRPQEVLFPFHVCASYGERKTMEDRYSVVGCLGNDPFASLYCVFDGHGGRIAADFCREYMHRHIVQTVNKHKVNSQLETKSIVDFIPSRESLKESFISLDDAFRKTDPSPYVGSTALVLLTRENRFWIAHVGDSKALLVRSDGSSEFLTEDHKPSNPIEKTRIEACGGRISDNRIEGILAMSRAIGDRIFKGYVIAEPDVNEHELVKAEYRSYIAMHAANQVQVFDSAIILGSDGLWDALSAQEATDIVRNTPNIHSAHALVAKALESRKNSGASYSHDNVTALVVDLTRMNQERSPIASTSQNGGPCSPLANELNAATHTLLRSTIGTPITVDSPNSFTSSQLNAFMSSTSSIAPGIVIEKSPFLNKKQEILSSPVLHHQVIHPGFSLSNESHNVFYPSNSSQEFNSTLYDIQPVIDQYAVESSSIITTATPADFQHMQSHQFELQANQLHPIVLPMQATTSSSMTTEQSSSRVRKQRPKLTIDVRNEDGEIPGAAGGLGT